MITIFMTLLAMTICSIATSQTVVTSYSAIASYSDAAPHTTVTPKTAATPYSGAMLQTTAVPHITAASHTTVPQNSIKDYSQNLEVVKMDTSINSLYYSSESPFISPSDLMLFFISARPVVNARGKVSKSYKGDNLWMATRSSLHRPWQTVFLKNISSYLNNGVAGISLDGLKLFLRIGNGMIYVYHISLQKGRNRLVPINRYYGINLPKGADIGSVAVSADEKTFYISSNMLGGYGGFDIWKTEYDEITKKWVDWQNLGDFINTSGDEISISMSSDENTLYISSNGHGGVGGCDIFRVDKDSNGEWIKEMVNLGRPINTPLNDIYFSSSVGATSSHAYYSSQRGDISSEIYDIYSVNYKSPVSHEMFEGHSDSASTVEAERLDNEKQVVVYSVPDRVLVKVRDENLFRDSLYRIISAISARYKQIDSVKEQLFKDVAKTGKYNSQRVVEEPVRQTTPALENNVLSKYGYMEAVSVPKYNDKIYFKNILFKKGKSALQKNSFSKLNRLYSFLRRFPDIIVEVGGHTSSEGGYEFNQKLSESRAEAVKNYLVEKGIAAWRLQTHGYSYFVPVEDDATEFGRMFNRRVEIRVIE